MLTCEQKDLKAGIGKTIPEMNDRMLLVEVTMIDIPVSFNKMPISFL